MPDTAVNEVRTTHLWEANHSYYCNEGNYYAAGNDQPFSAWKRWQDFVGDEGEADLDYNLLFRWDWAEGEDAGAEAYSGDDNYRNGILKLFFMGQRKGLYRWATVQVCRADEPAVLAFLRPRWEHLQAMWAPIASAESSSCMTVAGQTSRLDANEIWEFLFNRTKDAVPEELTNEILADLAAHINKLWIAPFSDQHRREAEAVDIAALVADAYQKGAADWDHAQGKFPDNSWSEGRAEYVRSVMSALAASPSSPASGVRVKALDVLPWRYDLEAVPRDRDFLIQFDHKEVTIGRYLDNSKSPWPYEGIQPCRTMRPNRVGEKIVAWREMPAPDTQAPALSAIGEHP